MTDSHERTSAPCRNAVSILLPAQGFASVVQLVLAGFVSRLPLGYDAIDDLQLAVELVLRSIAVVDAQEDAQATMSLVHDDAGLTISVGPFTKASVEEDPNRSVLDSNLKAFLVELVDEIEESNGRSPAIVLRKNLSVQPA